MKIKDLGCGTHTAEFRKLIQDIRELKISPIEKRFLIRLFLNILKKGEKL